MCGSAAWLHLVIDPFPKGGGGNLALSCCRQYKDTALGRRDQFPFPARTYHHDDAGSRDAISTR